MFPESNPNANRIGPVLRAIRQGSGFTIRGLAREVNVTHSHLLRVEAGEREISPDLLLKVLAAIANRLLRRGDAA